MFAITLHEVAHGWAARYCGDRTAELLGRLSLNPLSHIDPIGTMLVPGLLLWLGGPLIGWAKPVPVAVRALRNPRRAMVFVALAGPAATFAMAAFWCLVLAARVRFDGSATFRVTRRGAVSMPRSAGDSTAMGFFLAFMILGRVA